MKTSSRMTPLQEEAAYNTGSAHDRGGGGGGGVILVNWSPARWEERQSQVSSFTITVRRTERVLKASFSTASKQRVKKKEREKERKKERRRSDNWVVSTAWTSFLLPVCTARARLPPSHHHVLHVLAIQHSNQHSNHEGRSVTQITQDQYASSSLRWNTAWIYT